MAPLTRSARGFTRTELLVILALIGILIILAIPFVTGVLLRGALISCVSNARFIHLATFSMATDGEANKDPALGWPGDLKVTGRIANLSDFVSILVSNHYFSPGELVFFSNTGFKSYVPNASYKPYKGTLSSGSNGVLDPPFTDENCAYKIFLVKKDDPADTVFLTSKNYTYNTLLNPNAKPYGDKGFIVMHKGGDVSVFKKEEAQTLQFNQSFRYVGPLPGGSTVESAENCLNPGQ